jgi:hypothetical protein
VSQPVSAHDQAAGSGDYQQTGRPPGVAEVPAPAARARRVIPGCILGGGLLGALLLLVAEFTTLFELKTSASRVPIRSIGAGSHHAYALVPIALFVAVLAFGVWRVGSRSALLAIGVLGVLALLIGLLGDLPDVHRSGLIATAGRHYTTATANPGAGLYLETLGAVVLLVTSVCGFLLLAPPATPRRRPPSARRTSRAPTGP